VPRHPQRFETIGSAIASRNFIWQKRSDDRPIAANCQVLLGDSMGEMLAYYASATVAYVGGGLLPFGTHNLIEACAVGCPVILGPHTFNFAEAARGALSAGAARSAPDAAGVVALALEILRDADLRGQMALAAETFAKAHRGATEKSVAALCAALPISAATGY
jgi:3-deoxy-D-manno-octulosonic-acid transferase